MNTQHTPQMIIPNNFGTPTGTPLNYDELQARIAAVKRTLAFAEEQRDYYEAAYAEYVSKAEKLEAGIIALKTTHQLKQLIFRRIPHP